MTAEPDRSAEQDRRGLRERVAAAPEVAPGAAPGTGSRRRGSRTAVAALGQAPLVLVLIGVAVGVGLALTGAWRIGAAVIGLSVGVGAVQRLLLPEPAVGLLAVRSRGFDVFALGALAVGIVALAVVVPASV